jgi:hypothetical protein
MDFVSCGSWPFCCRRILLIALKELKFPLPSTFFRPSVSRSVWSLVLSYLFGFPPFPPLDDVHSEEFPAFPPFSRGVQVSYVTKHGGIAEI